MTWFIDNIFRSVLGNVSLVNNQTELVNLFVEWEYDRFFKQEAG